LRPTVLGRLGGVDLKSDQFGADANEPVRNLFAKKCNANRFRTS